VLGDEVLLRQTFEWRIKGKAYRARKKLSDLASSANYGEVKEQQKSTMMECYK